MSGMSIGRIAWWVAAAALLAHAGLTAGGVWSFGPINYDDPQVLALLEDKSVGELLTTTTWYAYKPIYFLSLKIDTIFGDAAVHVGHVVNLLLHALGALLLVRLLYDLFGSRWIAGAAGLLFAVHPVHVENVAWFSERKDVLSFVLVLLAHGAYRRGRASGRSLLLAPAILLLLGGLSKGTVWSYVGILAVDEWLHLRRTRTEGGTATAGQAFARLLPVLIVGVGGVLLDVLVAQASGAAGIEHGVTTIELMAAMAGVHLRYLLSLLAPVGLALDYAIDPAGSWGLLAIGGLLLAVFAVAGLVAGIRRGSALLAWASAFWIFGLAPVNNVWPRTAALMADRYLYIPAIGLYILLAVLLRKAGAAKGGALGVVAIVLLVLCEARTGLFASSERLWSDTIEKVPQSALAHVNRGLDATSRSAWARALEDADKALALEPRPEFQLRAHLLRSGALFGLQRWDDLLEEANRAAAVARELERNPLVREDPRQLHAQAEIFRGNALEAQGWRTAATDAYLRATQVYDRSASAWFNYGTMLAGSRDEDGLGEAVDALRRARDLDPGRLDIELQLATVHGRRGDKKRALSVLDRAEQRHGTRNPEVLYTRATVMLSVANDWAAARKLLRTLRDVDPNHPKGKQLEADIEIAIGRASLRKGRAERDRKLFKQAIEHFDQALVILPSHWQAHVFAGDAFAEQGRYRAARKRYREARTEAPDQRWIAGLTARTAALEAALVALRDVEGQTERAARVMGGAIALPDVTRIDLGFAPLQDELGMLRELLPLVEKGEQPEAAYASDLLAATALLVTGDERSALEKLQATMGRLGGSERSRSLLDAALVLRATLYERQTEFDLALRDYRLLAQRRPDDILPPLRELQIDLRIAEARRRTAAGHGDDPERLANARRTVQERAEKVRAFADEHPGSSSAGMLAVQAEINLQRWIQAVRRLNGLAERFQRTPSVYRGFNAVYVAWYTQTRDRMHIEEATRNLRIATDLDPRDARTAMDASQLARVAGDLSSALKHAERARALESYGGGPASRMLADLHVELGHKALEGGQMDEARAAADAARRVDPNRAGSWVLEGEIALKSPTRDRFLRAYDLAKKAKELEPYHPNVNGLLARCHKGSATTALLMMGRYREPPPDTPGWDEKRRKQVRQYRERYRQQAINDLNLALILDPGAEDAKETERTVRRLEEASATTQAERQAKAREHYERGIRFQIDGKRVDALYAFHEAIQLSPRFARAHGRLVQMVVLLLEVLPVEDPEGLKTARKYEEMAWRSLHALEALDIDRSIAQLWYFRGELNHFKFRTTPDTQPEAREVARLAALAGFEHFVLRLRAAGAKDGESQPLRIALARLATLRKGDD
ncbi:MAG: tetratricopeptide repeat protein [Planctomycetota bacterium]|nr:tetratricopeptide repeat protein [Planctomycetota bacterium]